MFFLSLLSKLAVTLTSGTDFDFLDGTLTIKTNEALADVNTTPFVGDGFTVPITTVLFDPALSPTSIGKNCFNSLAELTTIAIPNTVTTIGEGAFKGCIALKSFTFPVNADFKRIEASTFSGCKALISNKQSETFKIPETIEYIGANAFEGCIGLSIITLPIKTARIDVYAFSDCKPLYITILGTAVVNQSSFAGCTSIKKVIIYDKLALKLNEIFFDSNSIITSVELLDKITELPSGAFSGLSGVTSIEIPKTVSVIGENAFDGCSSLEKIVYEGKTDFKDLVLGNIPPTAHAKVLDKYPAFSFGGLGVVMEGEIGDGLVYSYDSTKSSLEFTEGATEIPAFADPTPNPLERFKGAKEVIVGGEIPSIGANAFNGFTNIETLTLSPFTKSIGADAFNDSLNIHSITVPGSVTGFKTFENCQNINKVSIVADDTLELSNPIGTLFPKSKGAINELKFSKTINKLPAAAFADLTAVRSVTIPTDVTDAGLGAKPFTNCNSLEEIHYYGTSSMASADLGLPAGKNPRVYTKIDYQGAFGSIAADKITKVNMLGDFKWTTNPGKTIVDISPVPGLIGTSGLIDDFTADRKSPFSQPEFANLKEVKLGEGVTRVGSFLFNECSKLDTIHFPPTLKYIGESAFNKCTALTSVNIPQKVESIEQNAFNGCTSLTNVVLPGKECHTTSFAGCANIESLTILNKLDIVISEVFEASKDKITNVKIADGVEKIRDSAFKGLPSIKGIEIPASVKKIGVNAFQDCTNLETIKYNGKMDFSGIDLGIPENTTVYVTDAYKGNKFGNNELIIINDISNEPQSNKLSAGAIAGIVIGVIVFIAAIGFCVYWFAFRKPKSVKDASDDQKDKKDDNNDEYYIPEDEDGAKV